MVDVDPELVLQESDREEEVAISENSCPHSFDYDVWEKWTLKSGIVIAEKLKEVADTKGHPLR